MKTKYLFLFLMIFSLGLTISSCEKDREPELLAHKINKFTHDLYKNIYLWNEDIPPTLDPMAYVDEQEFFKKMIHTDDQWSSLTDNIAAMRESVSGTTLTYGCSYYLNNYSEINQIIGVVKYVYANSPAEKAGLERGDIIVKINGSPITLDNYKDILYSNSIRLGLGEYKNGRFSDIDKTAEMTAVKMYEDPILETKVFNTSAGKKIGYLHYTTYLLDSHRDLNKVFNGFKANGVKDVILDLRYNGGGYALTSLFLSSLLTTKNALDSEDIALKEIWNPNYNRIWISEGEKTEDRFTSKLVYENSNTVVVDEVTGNLDLSRLYVLVSPSSASASESTIASLELYLDVTLIGERTAGKFCGGILVDPSFVHEGVDPEIKNWGCYTMIFRFANKEGVTNCIGGYAPDYEIEKENPLNLYPIGSEEDPQIAKALELITGVPTPASQRSVPIYPGYEQIEHRRNMLDGKLIELR